MMPALTRYSVADGWTVVLPEAECVVGARTLREQGLLQTWTSPPTVAPNGRRGRRQPSRMTDASTATGSPLLTSTGLMSISRTDGQAQPS